MKSDELLDLFLYLEMMDMGKDTEKVNELRSYLSKHSYSYSEYGTYSPMENVTLPATFRDLQQRIRDMEVYEDDTWVLAYPRSGSTWTRAMIWLIANDLDYSNQTDLLLRFPFVEFDMCPRQRAVLEATINCNLGDTIEYINKLKRPRFVYSHLPLSLLPSQLLEKKPKIVLVKRNPYDVAVSYYHIFCSAEGFAGTKDMFFECFRKGLLMYGCYWHYLASFRKFYEEPNVLNLTYENMKWDYMSVLKKTADYFGKKYTDDELKKLESYLNISNMKTNQLLNLKDFFENVKDIHKRSVSHSDFVRKGVVGGYKDEMSEETVQKFDEWNLDMKKKLNLIDVKEIPY